MYSVLYILKSWSNVISIFKTHIYNKCQSLWKGIMKLIWNILWRHLLLNQVQKICYCPATLQKVTCRCPIRSHLLDSYRWHTELLQTIGINTNSQKHKQREKHHYLFLQFHGNLSAFMWKISMRIKIYRS